MSPICPKSGNNGSKTEARPKRRTKNFGYVLEPKKQMASIVSSFMCHVLMWPRNVTKVYFVLVPNETRNVQEFVCFFIEMRKALMSISAWLASIGINNCYNRNIHYTSASPSFFLAWSIMKWVSRCSSWTISLDSFGSVLVPKRNQNFWSSSFWSSCDRTLTAATLVSIWWGV